MKKIFKKILMGFQGFIGVTSFLLLIIALFILVFQILDFGNYIKYDTPFRRFFEFFGGKK